MEKNMLKQVEQEMKRRGIIKEQEMMDTNPFVEMISKLVFSRDQTHVYHWQSQSFSEHMALNGYYDGIPAIADGLVESYQGKYGILKGYKSYQIADYTTSDEVIGFLKGLSEDIENLRQSIQESYIQNQIDTAVELIQSTIYKLENLK